MSKVVEFELCLNSNRFCLVLEKEREIEIQKPKTNQTRPSPLPQPAGRPAPQQIHRLQPTPRPASPWPAPVSFLPGPVPTRPRQLGPSRGRTPPRTFQFQLAPRPTPLLSALARPLPPLTARPRPSGPPRSFPSRLRATAPETAGEITGDPFPPLACPDLGTPLNSPRDPPAPHLPPTRHP